MTDETEQEPEIAVSERTGDNMLMDPNAFAQAKRVATVLSQSQLVPKHLQNSPSDCFLALHMAHRLGEDPLMVCQNITIIQGTAGWKATWMISRANRSGVFQGPITFDSYHDDERGLTVVAKGVIAQNGEEKTATADMLMAEAEGWTKNPKYQSMPEQMLCYRSASFLVRKYCPEVLMGYQTAEEVEDMAAAGQLKDVSPRQSGATEALSQLKPAEETEGQSHQGKAGEVESEPHVETGEIVDADWVSDYDGSTRTESDDDILGEVHYQLDDMVEAGNVDAVRERIERAKAISDESLRNDTLGELDEALATAQANTSGSDQ